MVPEDLSHRYRYSWISRLEGLLILALCVLGTAVLFEDPDVRDWHWASAAVMLLLLGAYSLYLLWAVLGSVEVSETGLCRLRPFRPPVALRWDAIARVKGASLGRLEFWDGSGLVKVRLDPDLIRYPELVDRVLHRRPDLWAPVGQHILHRSRAPLVTCGVMAAQFAAFSVAFFVIGDPVMGTTMAAFLALVAGVYILVELGIPRRIEVRPADLRFEYLFRERRVSRDEIAEMALRVGFTQQGPMAFVELRLSSGKRLRLGAVREGAALAYCVLKLWRGENAAQSG